MVFLEISITGFLLDISKLFLGFLLVGREALYGKLLVEEVGRDIVHVDELHTCLFYDLAIPFAVGAVATLNLAARPFANPCKDK